MSDDTTSATTGSDTTGTTTAAGAGVRVCRFPGCDRPSRPDPGTGRPSLYCEQPGPDGGPVHNRATAWRARRAADQQATPTSPGGPAGEQSPVGVAPVSMARVSLEQRVAQLPTKIDDLQAFLAGVVADLRAAGDVEAAGAEVADAHRDALAKITAAEQQVADAERARRGADRRADDADTLRAEADAAAEDATAQTARVREELGAQLAQARADAEHAATEARQQLAAAVTETEHARAEAATARGELTALQAQAAADKHALAALRDDLDQVRADARAQRDALQQAAEERATALTQALAAARETVEAYKAQLHGPAGA
ncbi:MAG TPA: hypothetical protein VF299_01225 [Mycobacterium sp.]